MKTKTKARRTPAPKSKAPLLETFLKSLVELYPFDRLTPGLVTSFIPETSKFYASVVRYENAGEKVVLCKTIADTLEEAETNVIAMWKNRATATALLRKNIVVLGGKRMAWRQS